MNGLVPTTQHKRVKLGIGDTIGLTHQITQADIDLTRAATGEATVANPSMTQPAAPVGSSALNSWIVGLVSALIDTQLPGPGSTLLNQKVLFHKTPPVLDTIHISLTVLSQDQISGSVTLDCRIINGIGEALLSGWFEVLPAEAERPSERFIEPHIHVDRHNRLAAIIAKAASGRPLPTAVVMPIDAVSLTGPLEAMAAGLIAPILIGPAHLVRSTATECQLNISACRLIDAVDGPAASASAVQLVRDGEVDLIMKGDLHSDVLMHPIVASTTGLRTKRRLSHVFVIDTPEYPRLLLITDAAVNIAPTLSEKADIVQNAINLAQTLGISVPKVAIVAAVELINDRMPSTLDAAALCKMADRGQITGGILDGPLAFDNAIDEVAARTKGIVSPVAGKADILLVPDLEAGNMLVKELTFLAGAEAAGVVVGAKVPIVLTSRADSAHARLSSCAIAVLMARSGSFK